MIEFDAEKSMQNKKDGMEKVAASNLPWMEAVRNRLRIVLKGREGELLTGEDIRATLTELGLEPNHPNAWGSLINTLIKKKVLIPTSQYRPMRDPRSHARSTRIYILNAWKSVESEP
jgi:hypothetical protein